MFGRVSSSGLMHSSMQSCYEYAKKRFANIEDIKHTVNESDEFKRND